MFVLSRIFSENRFPLFGIRSSSTLLQSHEIKDFLAAPQSTGSVVVAPKGCGKTLLIMHKRRGMSSKERDYILIPSGQMVNINPGAAADFNNEDLAEVDAKPDFWSLLWQVAICISVIRAYRDRGHGDRVSAANDGEIANPTLRGPFDIFAHLLKTRIREYNQLNTIFLENLLPIIQSCHDLRVAVFVDNIDEYFLPHLEKTTPDDIDEFVRDRFYGQLSRSFWDAAQIGFLIAAKELKAQNPHMKVYGAIRTEAINSYEKNIANMANLRSVMLELNYGGEELKAIFEKNIQAEKKCNIYTDDKYSTLEKFFGPENDVIRHQFTGELEDVFDYCLRHTMGCPRDLMRLGRRISKIPRDTRSSFNIREAVNNEAAEICVDYLGQVKNHFVWFDDDKLFPLISSTALSRRELEKIATAYYDQNKSEYIPDSPLAIFADLYHSGLLGITTLGPNRRTKIQRFKSVSSIGSLSNIEQRILPESDVYLIHPVLGSYLRKEYPNRINRINSINIINPNADWNNDTDMRYALKADIVGFSKLAENKVTEKNFRAHWDDLISDISREVDFCDPEGGDGVLIADRSPYLLFQQAHKIHSEIVERYDTTARFGMEYGKISFSQDDNGKERPVAGDTFVTAERLRVASLDGSISMLEHTRNEIDKLRLNCSIQRVEDENQTRAENRQGSWILGKEHEEITVEDIYTVKAAESPIGNYY